MKRETKIQIVIIVILVAILSILLFFTIEKFNFKRTKEFINNPMQDSSIKDTKKEDVDAGLEVNEKNIDLTKYKGNINISEGGEYNITGEFNFSIIVDTTENVKLNLNNVTINSSVTSAIANINSGELVINLLKDTTNILKDNGSSEYDGCIFSSGKLAIEGEGSIKIYGNQDEGEGIATDTNDIIINGGDIYIESYDDGINAGGDGGTITINDGNIFIKASGDGIDSNKNLIINGGTIYTIGSSLGGDAGIDTDKGFEINGGEVIALGSDMLQTPEKTSKQEYISFTLNSKIDNGSIISLKDENNKEIISFEAKDSFKTLIISNSKLKNEKYYLYVDGKKTEYCKLVN